MLRRTVTVGLTGVRLALLAVVAQRAVVQQQVDLDGAASGLVVERVLPQHVLQLQQVHVGAQRHLPHAVGVEVKLVICDLHKMLTERRNRGVQRKSKVEVWITHCKSISR